MNPHLSLVLTEKAEHELAHPTPAGPLSVIQREVLAHVFADALAYRLADGYCAACVSLPAGSCGDCDADLDRCGDYLHLARELGIEVPS